MKAGPPLTKARYLRGAQCGLNLWYSLNRDDVLPAGDEAQAQNVQGNETREWAKKVFPQASEIDNFLTGDAAAEATRSLVEAGQEVIFKAAAVHAADGSCSRVDVLRKISGTEEWDLIDIKGSTSVKDYHVDDLAFQYRVFTGAGYNIARCLVMLVDRDYVRHGAVDAAGLFRFDDVTGIAVEKQAEVSLKALELGKIMVSASAPGIRIGAQCHKPFPCSFHDHCWKDVPDYSLYDIFSAKKADAFVEDLGSCKIERLPEVEIPGGAKGIDVRSYLRGQLYIEPENIRGFLDRLRHPLYFLDYETIGPAVPVFEGTRPFQTVPFQFSLHVEAQPGAGLQHFSFLHRARTDPRPFLAEALVRLCGSTGSVITYNQAFEEGVNRELMLAFPEHAAAIAAINARMVDLLVPFRKRWLYHPDQRGSASIKKVLPAFTTLTYEGLGIGNGLDASRQYADFMAGRLANDQQATLFHDLEAYCSLDTLAMKALLDVLAQKIATPS